MGQGFSWWTWVVSQAAYLLPGDCPIHCRLLRSTLASTYSMTVKCTAGTGDYSVCGLCPVFPQFEKHRGLVAAVTLLFALRLALSQSTTSQHPHPAHVFLRPSHISFPEVTAHESPLWGDAYPYFFLNNTQLATIPPPPPSY